MDDQPTYEELVQRVKDLEAAALQHAQTGKALRERKLAEQALRESEVKYRSILQNAQVAIFRTRISDGKVLECNDRYAQTFGYATREECIRDYLSADHYVDPGIRERMVEAVRSQGGVHNVEARMFRKDGEIVWVRFSVRANVEAGYLDGAGYDVTQEKAALQALKESEQKYKAILDNIQEGYYEVDIEGNFTFFNRSMCEILCYSPEEMMGMNNRQYTDKEFAKKVYDTFNRVYTTGSPAKGFDWELIRKDGAVRIVETSVALIKDSKHQPVGFRGIARDGDRNPA
ncbi:MAG: PAS domain-containing protein [Deltaproteobacteria bacterium]|nr:PAS domain-containing protein [Deltaproteobacteria bacterium]